MLIDQFPFLPEHLGVEALRHVTDRLSDELLVAAFVLRGEIGVYPAQLRGVHHVHDGQAQIDWLAALR